MQTFKYVFLFVKIYKYYAKIDNNLTNNGFLFEIVVIFIMQGTLGFRQYEIRPSFWKI